MSFGIYVANTNQQFCKTKVYKYVLHSKIKLIIINNINSKLFN